MTARPARPRRMNAAGTRLNETSLRLLALLARTTLEDRRLKSLTQTLGVHPSSLTKALDQLDDRMLATRIQHPDDRRCQIASITPQGRAELERLHALMIGTPAPDVRPRQQVAA